MGVRGGHAEIEHMLIEGGAGVSQKIPALVTLLLVCWEASLISLLNSTF